MTEDSGHLVKCIQDTGCSDRNISTLTGSEAAIRTLIERPFHYVRHGETDWNNRGLMQGRVDTPLNETGRRQARRAGQLLADVPLATICSSPLQRALETARIINAGRDCPIEIFDGLQECGFGPFEGQRKTEWYQDWLAGAAIDGVEPLDRFIHRARKAIEQALRCAPPVLLVAHGGVYWALNGETGHRLGDAIPNGLPALHQPPARGEAHWQVTFLG